jgi:hypothetical protein
MATMTQAQITAELQRKAALGKPPSNAANVAQYNQIKASAPAAAPAKYTPAPGSAMAGYKALLDANGGKAPTPLIQATPDNLPPAVTPDNAIAAPPAANGNGVSSNGNAQGYIDQLNEARRQQTIAGLDKSRNAALSNLQGEKSAIQPKYYDQRNQAAAGSQQQARNFAEFMAARGGTNSGANAQAEITNGMALQGNLGSLGRQEAQAYTDIERRTTDVNNAYQSDVAGAEAGMQGDRMQMLLQDYYKAQERGDMLSQQAIQNELAKAGLTGVLGGQQTLAGVASQRQGQQMNIDNSFAYGDRAGMILNPQTDPSGYLRQIQNGKAPMTFEAQQQQQQNQQWQQNFDRSKYESDRGYQFQQQQQAIQNGQWQQQYGLDVDKYGFQKASELWSQAFQESQSQDDSDRQWAQLDWQTQQQEDKYNGLSPEQVLSNVRSKYTEPVYQTDQFGKQTKTGERLTTDPQKRDDMFLEVVDMGLPSSTQTRQVLLSLGFKNSEIDTYIKQHGGDTSGK